ncbi:MAG: flagellar basal-body rod protein FlgG [Gammaproteobacteria bacterium]|nr:flagellar basal-body rod protein FlgG [Gammaproteobacteria bacterium]
MIDSLYIGATGMQAQQMNIDTVANNLANVNTAGFKRNRVEFEDLLYRTMDASKSDNANAARSGMGTAIASSGKVFTVGELKKTEQPLDLAIRGQGFFEVTLPDGTLGYTRYGALQLNADGALVTHDGHPLSNSIQVPSDATAIVVEADGRVLANVPGQTQPIDIGQIELANFVSANNLKPVGDNLYLATEGSGEALRSQPGQNGVGNLAQGFIESSNVKLIDEMINLIVAQRAYEINSKVVQASDELLSISNNLFR